MEQRRKAEGQRHGAWDGPFVLFWELKTGEILAKRNHRRHGEAETRRHGDKETRRHGETGTRRNETSYSLDRSLAMLLHVSFSYSNSSSDGRKALTSRVSREFSRRNNGCSKANSNELTGGYVCAVRAGPTSAVTISAYLQEGETNNGYR